MGMAGGIGFDASGAGVIGVAGAVGAAGIATGVPVIWLTLRGPVFAVGAEESDDLKSV